MSRTVYGCFYKLGVLFVGVRLVEALQFWVCIRASDFWKLPYGVTHLLTTHLKLVALLWAWDPMPGQSPRFDCVLVPLEVVPFEVAARVHSSSAPAQVPEPRGGSRVPYPIGLQVVPTLWPRECQKQTGPTLGCWCLGVTLCIQGSGRKLVCGLEALLHDEQGLKTTVDRCAVC